MPRAADAQGAGTQVTNGLLEWGEPTTVAPLRGTAAPEDAWIFCSGVLVGCDIVLTAAHCFYSYLGEKDRVFFQHAGFAEIESSVYHPSWNPFTNPEAREEDIAVLKLASPVTGITPSRINTTATPGPGTPGFIVGFGRDPTTEVSIFEQNPGRKRSGSMELAACSGDLAGNDVLCWDPPSPQGPPGSDVTTCNVDSGGPLFTDDAGTRVVAGLTKGAIAGAGGTCEPPTQPYDVNVYRHRVWIEQQVVALGGMDLAITSCGGGIPQLAEDAAPGVCDDTPWGPGEETRICGFEGTLNPTQQQDFDFEVPAGSTVLRVTLNGRTSSSGEFDVDLYVKAGQAATTLDYDCAGLGSGMLGACEFDAPQAGPWNALVVHQLGDDAEFQVTVTAFGQESTPPPVEAPALGPAARLLLVAALLAVATRRAGPREPHPLSARGTSKPVREHGQRR